MIYVVLYCSHSLVVFRSAICGHVRAEKAPSVVELGATTHQVVPPEFHLPKPSCLEAI